VAVVRRWSPLTGIVFLVLYIPAVLLLWGGPGTGNGAGDAPAKVIAYYDHGERSRFQIGLVLGVLAVFFLFWFIASLRQVVLRPGEGDFLANLVTLGGGVYLSGALLNVGLTEAIKTMSGDTYQHQVFPGLIHAANDTGYMLHSVGAVGLGVLILAFSIGTWRRFPRWHNWLGIVAGILALISFFFFTMLPWLLWIAVTSILLTVRPTHGRRAAEG
jgi:hypothetical protein